MFTVYKIIYLKNSRKAKSVSIGERSEFLSRKMDARIDFEREERRRSLRIHQRNQVIRQVSTNCFQGSSFAGSFPLLPLLFLHFSSLPHFVQIHYMCAMSFTIVQFCGRSSARSSGSFRYIQKCALDIDLSFFSKLLEKWRIDRAISREFNVTNIRHQTHNIS